jgi:hypothetical protein
MLQAFRGGRLLVHKMRCVTPLVFPLEWRTGMSDFDSLNPAEVIGMDALVLVMDVGVHPVHLTARTSQDRINPATDPTGICPFRCSGVPDSTFTCKFNNWCDCRGSGGPTADECGLCADLWNKDIQQHQFPSDCCSKPCKIVCMCACACACARVCVHASWLKGPARLRTAK